MNRRDFLKFGGGICGLGAVPVPMVHLACGTAARRGSRVGAPPTLVVLYLRGGQDALNTVCPTGDRDYAKMRPTIALPRSGGEGGDPALTLDGIFDLHPSLSALAPLWRAKTFAPIVCTGSPHPTRSHFDAQDFMEYAAPGLRSVRDGWLNRFLQATDGERQERDSLRAVALQSKLPRSLRGAFAASALPARVARQSRTLDEFEELYGADEEAMGAGGAAAPDDAVKDAGRTTVRALRRYAEILRADTGSKAKYPGGPIGRGLARLGHLIRAGEPVEVACVDANGWDHHIDEGAADGKMAPMLKQLGDAVATFARDIGAHFDKTLVLTMTEFGRTCHENGNRGTDHGHGSVMLACGGGLAQGGGGKVLGRWTGLNPDALYEGRDLRVTTDFRDVMAEVLAGHCGFELPKGFFPEHKVGRPVGLFG